MCNVYVSRTKFVVGSKKYLRGVFVGEQRNNVVYEAFI